MRPVMSGTSLFNEKSKIIPVTVGEPTELI